MLQWYINLIRPLKKISHPNVASFIGVTTDPLQMVVERISDGNLTKYLEEHPEADRISLVSPLLLIAFDQLG